MIREAGDNGFYLFLEATIPLLNILQAKEERKRMRLEIDAVYEKINNRQG